MMISVLSNTKRMLTLWVMSCCSSLPLWLSLLLCRDCGFCYAVAPQLSMDVLTRGLMLPVIQTSRAHETVRMMTPNLRQGHRGLGIQHDLGRELIGSRSSQGLNQKCCPRMQSRCRRAQG